MKLLSLALLSLLLSSPAAAAPTRTGAQESARRVLVQGEPPLTTQTVDEVAEFFGWLFESPFTPSQRGELERVLVAVWRAGDRKEIEGASNFGGYNAKLEAASPEKRAEVRAAMLPEVLKQVRAESTDFSRLLLSAYEARGAETPRPYAAGAEATEAGELVGSWRSSEVGLIGYQNTVTGSTRPGRGTTMQYRFLPGGRYEYNGYLETTVYNCTTTLFNTAAGTYRVEGGRLSLTPETSRWQQRNNCAPNSNKEQPGKLDPAAYAWRVSEEGGVRRLCLSSSEGGEVCYRRE